MQNNNKVLLSIKNLKQYFPVGKNKRLFVKANDGISLDIYEGETFGLVGESGCGKSTFGRVILQLYHQTYGRTLYYGRTLDSLAPAYFRDTMKKLEVKRKRMYELRAESEKLDKELKAIDKSAKDNDAKVFDKMEAANQARKAAEDAYLDIVTLVGGLIVVDDLSTVIDAYLARYDAAVECRDENMKLTRLRLILENEQTNEKDQTGKAQKAMEKVTAQQKVVEGKESVLAQKHKVIDALRAKNASMPGFAEHDAHLSEGIDLSRLEYEEMRLLRRDVQLIFQDPYSSLNPRMTVGQIVGEGLVTHNMFLQNNDRMQEYVMKVMEECGLAPYMIHRYPHQFSGGQRQRICIARSLAVKPKFIVCDEAVSALDVSIQSQVINLLEDLKQKENLTYLFISHDLSVVKYISDRIGVMYLGSLVELARTEDIFARPTHPYTEALLAAIPTTDADRPNKDFILEGDIPSPINPPKGCKFHTRCRYCTDICKQVEPVFSEIEPGHFVACHHRP